MDFAKAKAFLQRKEGSASLYDHLTEVVLKLVSEQPDNALAVFEQISAAVKSTTFPALGKGERAGGQAAAAELAAARSAFLNAQAALFKAPAGDEEGSGGGEPVQDFTDESNYLTWAGVSFGATESFRIHLALKHLSAKFQGVKNLRFFGKLLGTKADYFVAEGIMDASGDEEEGAKDALGNVIQRTGEGPNKFTYFVTPAIGQAWTKLPNVTPHQIIVARQIRRFLSGDLSAAVSGHPPFPGNESNYLRALVALISAGTAIAPSGVFTAVDGDENGAIEPNAEEFEAPDLTSPDSWVHTDLSLNVLGRTKANPPKTDDEGNEIPDENAPEASAPLKSIGEDAPVSESEEEGGGSWDIRTCPSASGLQEGENGSMVVVRSLRFPGAFTVGIGKKYTSVYIGYGHEVSLAPLQPSLPAALPTEFDFTKGETLIKEKDDVIADPDAGKPAEGEEGAEE